MIFSSQIVLHRYLELNCCIRLWFTYWVKLSAQPLHIYLHHFQPLYIYLSILHVLQIHTLSLPFLLLPRTPHHPTPSPTTKFFNSDSRLIWTSTRDNHYHNKHSTSYNQNMICSVEKNLTVNLRYLPLRIDFFRFRSQVASLSCEHTLENCPHVVGKKCLLGYIVSLVSLTLIWRMRLRSSSLDLKWLFISVSTQ